jgi:hypothetical protein
VEAMRQGCPSITYQEGPASEIIESHYPLLKKLEIEAIVNQMKIFSVMESDTRFELAQRLIRRSLLFTSETFGNSFLKAMIESSTHCC